MASPDVRAILVPVDFSPCSKRALEQAVALTGRYFGATIDVLHVWDSARTPGATGRKDAREVEALRDMEQFLAEVARAGSVKVERIHAIGSPVAKILEATRKKTYDLIVMGTHGKADDREKLASVAREVADQAPCPVLTYGEQAVLS